jgi:hypothetical protein
MDENANGAPEATIEALQEQLAASEAELAASREAGIAAVERLKSALIAANPAIDATMLAGESVEEVEASFAAAAALVERVRDQVRREHAAAIPAGAPARGAAAPRTAIEKIRDGLARQAPRG